MRQWRNGGNSWLEETVGEVQTQEDLNGPMRLMIKSALQRMLDTELDVNSGNCGEILYQSIGLDREAPLGRSWEQRFNRFATGQSAERAIRTPLSDRSVIS